MKFIQKELSSKFVPTNLEEVGLNHRIFKKCDVQIILHNDNKEGGPVCCKTVISSKVLSLSCRCKEL
jgi:hypothetical protein